MSSLPNEIKHTILRYCDWSTLLNLRSVSSTWQSIAHSHLNTTPSSRQSSHHWYTYTTPYRTNHSNGNGNDEGTEDEENETLIGRLKYSLQFHVLQNFVIHLPISPGRLQQHKQSPGFRFDQTQWLSTIPTPPVDMEIIEDEEMEQWWDPPLNYGTKVHRIVGLLCAPHEDIWEIQLRQGEIMPGFIQGNDNDIEIPFSSDSLFNPRIDIPVPVLIRIRYADLVSNSYEETTDIKFLLAPSSDTTYITVKDLILALDEQLGTVSEWGGILPIPGLHFYVNPGGWVEITINTDKLCGPGREDSSYAPSESSECSEVGEVVWDDEGGCTIKPMSTDSMGEGQAGKAEEDEIGEEKEQEEGTFYAEDVEELVKTLEKRLCSKSRLNSLFEGF